jgi:shikimate dehydrogenase
MNNELGMRRFGLIGYPLEHSLSVPLHRAAFQSLGIAADYSLFTIQPLPEGKKDLLELLDQMRKEELQGLNITIPYKEKVIPFLDKLTPTAQAISAVNTLFMKDGYLFGDNTDAPGFLCDLYHHCPEFNTSVQPRNKTRRALILGAGGAARAVLFALANAGWLVWVAARRVEQARNLIASMDFYNSSKKNVSIRYDLPLTPQSIDPLLDDLDLIINATPVGMFPKIDDNPWFLDLDLPKKAFIYDLVYNPLETCFVRQANSAGLMAVTGLGMLVEQAALADERWIGKSPPRVYMLAAVANHLRGTYLYEA